MVDLSGVAASSATPPLARRKLSENARYVRETDAGVRAQIEENIINISSTPPIRLSASQLETFERDGYLLLPGLLRADEVAYYSAVVDELERSERADNNLKPHDSIESRDSVARAPQLLPLISHPAALGAMLDILGWDIQLTTLHTFVRVPTPDAQTDFAARVSCSTPT